MTTTTDQQLIRVGHSPDPDDAFMFHAIANDKIPTGNLKFVHELQDIETLNRRAMNGVPNNCVKCHDAIHGSNFSKEFRSE